MNHQFNPGDSALLLTDVGPLISGSVVELIERLGAGTEVGLKGGGKAECCEDSWVFSHILIPEPRLAFAPERLLMPLRGDFTPTEENSQAAQA